MSLRYDLLVTKDHSTLPIVLLVMLLVLLGLVWGYFFYHLS
jgi:uncharacterized membrane protein YwzB